MAIVDTLREMLRENRRKFDWANTCKNEKKKDLLKRDRRKLENLLRFECERSNGNR